MEEITNRNEQGATIKKDTREVNGTARNETEGDQTKTKEDTREVNGTARNETEGDQTKTKQDTREVNGTAWNETEGDQTKTKKDTREVNGTARNETEGDQTEPSYQKYTKLGMQRKGRNNSRTGGWYDVTVQVRDHLAYVIVAGRVLTQTAPYFHPAGGRAGLLMVRRQVPSPGDIYFKTPILATAAMNYGIIYYFDCVSNATYFISTTVRQFVLLASRLKLVPQLKFSLTSF